jgi:hypothetical protein
LTPGRGPPRGLVDHTDLSVVEHRRATEQPSAGLHPSNDARHLFLVVPVTNTNEEGRVREHPFRAVSRRMATFFGDPRREVDVVSVHVFGYGARENA